MRSLWSLRIRHAGCGWLVSACVITCLLVVANRMLGNAIYDLLVPRTLDQPKFRSMTVFLAIIGLLVPEWWLLDWCAERVRHVLRASLGARRDE